MSDEFDDSALPTSPGSRLAHADSRSIRLPRLITRIYAASDPSLRARLLQRLLDPLGTLGMVAIAAGAFAGFLQRRDVHGVQVTIEDVGRVSGDQVAELVRFVSQVSPEALQAVAAMLAETPAGITAFGVSAVVLLTRALGRAGPGAMSAGTAQDRQQG